MKNEEKILNILEILQSDMNTMKETQDLMQIQLKEHGSILGSLQHSSEAHKADIDNLTYQVASIAGELKSFRAEANERFDRIEEKIAGHDIKIEILDQTKSNKRKAK